MTAGYPSNAMWKLARVKDTMLGFEDHGIFTFAIHLEYYSAPEEINGRFYVGRQSGGQAAGLRGGDVQGMVSEILKAVGVSEWDHLKGKMVWALSTNSGVYGLAGVLGGSQEPFLFE